MTRTGGATLAGGELPNGCVISLSLADVLSSPISGCAGATGEAMVDRGLLTCAISRGDCAWLDNSAPDSAEAFPDEVKTRLA
jgi:hypothetical protein